MITIILLVTRHSTLHRVMLAPYVNILRPTQHQLERSQKEVVLRAFKNILSAPTVLSMVATIWAGLPPLIILAVAAGLISIETALEYHFNREKIFQSNGLSLFLRLL